MTIPPDWRPHPDPSTELRIHRMPPPRTPLPERPDPATDLGSAPHLGDQRLVIAYTQPPAELGFRASRFVRKKHGQTWWRRLDSLADAVAVAKQLVQLDIHGVIKKPKYDKPGSDLTDTGDANVYNRSTRIQPPPTPRNHP